MKFTIGWCELCDTHFVWCPKCGNNSCNSGYGDIDEGEVCDVCPLAYQIQELMWEFVWRTMRKESREETRQELSKRYTR